MMKSAFSGFLALASLDLLLASPVARPAHESPAPAPAPAPAPTINDGVVLNYALTLEYLERAFYRDGLANYTREAFVAAGFEDPFYDNLVNIYSDEQTHVDSIRTALEAAGVTPTEELQYCFPATDAASFVTLSSVLEGVGVSAYVGAASAIEEDEYLTVAAAILGIEARHASYIRASLGRKPFPNPFETPLGFNPVFTLAASFICGGSSPVALPFKPFPALSVAVTVAASAASSPADCALIAGTSPLTFPDAHAAVKTLIPDLTPETPVYALFYSGLSKVAVRAYPVPGTADYAVDKLPADISGQVYVLLGRSESDFGEENVIAGPAVLEVHAAKK